MDIEPGRTLGGRQRRIASSDACDGGSGVAVTAPAGAAAGPDLWLELDPRVERLIAVMGLVCVGQGIYEFVTADEDPWIDVIGDAISVVFFFTAAWFVRRKRLKALRASGGLGGDDGAEGGTDGASGVDGEAVGAADRGEGGDRGQALGA